MSELGFMSNEAQNQMESHTAAYLASWLQVLKEDKNEIFRAAAEAQRIADYLEQWRPAPADECERPEPEQCVQAHRADQRRLRFAG
jgi:antirestriction protein ArdC